jgi:hypothetical protein
VGEIFPDCFLGMGAGTEGEGVIVTISRPEERKTEEMVPVGVGEEETDAFQVVLSADLLPQVMKAGPGIDNGYLAGR